MHSLVETILGFLKGGLRLTPDKDRGLYMRRTVQNLVLIPVIKQRRLRARYIFYSVYSTFLILFSNSICSFDCLECTT